MRGSGVRSDKKQVLVEHTSFDWGKVDGATLRDAAKYLLDLAKTLPAEAVIDENPLGYDPTEIRVISYRDETDEEYAARKEAEAVSVRLAAEQQRRDEERRAKRAAYEKLKRELGYR